MYKRLRAASVRAPLRDSVLVVGTLSVDKSVLLSAGSSKAPDLNAVSCRCPTAQILHKLFEVIENQAISRARSAIKLVLHDNGSFFLEHSPDRL